MTIGALVSIAGATKTFAGASGMMQQLCSALAEPKHLYEESAPSFITESAIPNPLVGTPVSGTRISFPNAHTFTLDIPLATPVQAEQVKRNKDLAREALLTGSAVNICAQTNTSPHVVYVLEIQR